MDDDVNEREIHELIKQTSNHNMVRNLLFESLAREKELQRALSEVQIKNDKLKMELDIERRRTVIRVESSSSSETERAPSESPHANEGDLRDTFGTNSTILMQYRYDDIRDSYGRCVKRLERKSKQLKKVLQEAEFQRFLNIQLRDGSIKLHEKIEQICFRYLGLMDRRVEERNFLKLQIDELQMKLMKHELASSCKDEEEIEND